MDQQETDELHGHRLREAYRWAHHIATRLLATERCVGPTIQFVRFDERQQICGAGVVNLWREQTDGDLAALAHRVVSLPQVDAAVFLEEIAPSTSDASGDAGRMAFYACTKRLSLTVVDAVHAGRNGIATSRPELLSYGIRETSAATH